LRRKLRLSKLAVPMPQKSSASSFDVGIAPSADFRVFAEVFVADVVAADEGLAAVGDDNFAVVAKVELEAIGAALVGIKGAGLDSRGPQIGEVGAGQLEAADLVVEQVTADPGAGAGDQRVLGYKGDEFFSIQYSV
jgi:hypothetical protein